MSEVLFFDTQEELQEHLQKSREAAAEFIQPFQRELKAGDFYVHYNQEYDLIVYGEVLDPVESDREAGGDEEELAYLKKVYSQPHMADFRFAKAFSPMSPDGELGDIHISTVGMVITKEQFETFRALRWPQSDQIAEVRMILGRPYPGSYR